GHAERVARRDRRAPRRPGGARRVARRTGRTGRRGTTDLELHRSRDVPSGRGAARRPGHARSVSESRASFLDAFHVAWFELVDALRSRKALALRGLYRAASGAAASIFLRVLKEIETNAADLLHVAPTTGTGTMTSVLH